MTKHVGKTILTVALVVGLGFCAQISISDIILAWDTTGVSDGPATLLANNLIATDLDNTSGLNTLSRVGLNATVTANSFAGNNWNATDTFNTENDYFSFSVRADDGYSLEVSTLQYVVNGSNSGPGTGRWGYSIDGGSFVLQPSFAVTFATPGALATWDITDFSTEGTVEFRYWQFGSVSVNGGTASGTVGTGRISNIAGNDLVLNGTLSVVPEPGSLALMGLGSFGLWAFGRRRRA